MKFVLKLVSIIVFTYVAYLLYINFGDISSIKLVGNSALELLPNAIKSINSSLIYTGFFGAGIVVGSFWFAEHFMRQEDKIKAYKRELEKSSVSTSDSSSKVQVLEAKIKVLEKALEDALNK